MQKSLDQVRRMQASKSTQQYNFGRKSPSDVLSLTTHNSANKNFMSNKRDKTVPKKRLNHDSSSEGPAFVPRSGAKSPEFSVKSIHIHSKNRSQDRIIKKAPRHLSNISSLKKSPPKLLKFKPKPAKNLKKENQYMKSRKEAFKKHMEFTVRQKNRVGRSHSRIEKDVSESRKSEATDQLPDVVVKQTSPKNKAKLYKINNSNDFKSQNMRKNNAYASTGIMQRPNQRRKR